MGKKSNTASKIDHSLPEKTHFLIGEASKLCGVKEHVLRYWEQEFKELKPVKRRGNRRYYRPEDIITAKKIRDLLYDQGFTIKGAKRKLKVVKEKASKSIDITSIIGDLEKLVSLLD